ncbi:multicopper oxidase family protein [Streptomyces sp. NBC_00557]|uniref:multicopper oxidase family protein n=1 Tax=Streptomyces sp. NBC_00557 TaxID=2975776 RepID=UPI002E80C8A2|nr:multicopper oxidase family protein [Streptomyces sp. NBC_00557]WUC32774.1 multicopper oxidase family protein [Streptomyces sp. NBC_00557]
MTGGIARRRLLVAAALGGGALTAGGWALAGGSLTPGQPGLLLRSRTVLPQPFAVPLPVPQVLAPARSSATTDVYEIVQRAARLRILPWLETPAWTYGGTFPGPTLVSRSGRRTLVRHRNELPHPTVVHLHGGHTPHGSDGYPTALVLPQGGTASGPHGMAGMPGMSEAAGSRDTAAGERAYTYPMEQRAATLWYHDHRMGFTGPNVWQGLAGFHLVHDDEEDALPLPRGERDIPLMIADRAFAADGSFRYPALDPAQHTPGVTGPYMDGVLGDVLLVNGAPWPVLETQRLRYRLRLLNASNARRYRLALDPPPPGGGGLVQIGGDGGLLDRPLAHDTLDVAPAERFDVVVDFSRYRPGTRVRLVNRLGSGSTAHVMRFDVSTARPPADDTRIPDRLSAIPVPRPERATAFRTFHFQRRAGSTGWTINGRPYEPGRPLATVRLGTTELWRFVTDFHHPVHLHLDHFQVAARNGRSPGPYDAGWKDTVDLRPAESVEIVTRFTDYSGRFMLHCHNLEHEDMAMMADFVTE